jgi:hypothetical protein
MASVKKAADAAGRRLCFVGMSLNTYLEAAHRCVGAEDSRGRQQEALFLFACPRNRRRRHQPPQTHDKNTHSRTTQTQKSNS